MYVEELFACLDEKLGPDWKSQIDSEKVTAAIDEWLDYKINNLVHAAIMELPEEA